MQPSISSVHLLTELECLCIAIDSEVEFDQFLYHYDLVPFHPHLTVVFDVQQVEYPAHGHDYFLV
uniref:Uncharacterized protein n=1 Tax=Moniliophthora roreri TaxID=221103 RepID=A0A0W0F815_MONRR